MKDGIPTNTASGLNIEAYAMQWVDNNEATMDFLERNPDRCHLFRYEDFVADPKLWGRKVFEFIGEPWSDDLLDKWGGQELQGMGDNKIFKTKGVLIRPESSWQNWPKGMLRTLGRKMNPTLERLGYAAVGGE
jgi:hypothetical protein